MSPMPRCHFFDDQGRPIRGGCHRKETCRFPHPGTPGWENAPLPRARNPSQSRGAGGNRRDSWGAPPPAPKSNRVEPLDSSVWAPKSAGSSATSGWGAGKGDAATSSAGKVDSSWPSWGNDKETTDTQGSWNPPSADVNWSSIVGEDNVWGGGGWGASSSEDQSRKKSAENKKGNAETSESGWVVSSSRQTSSAGNASASSAQNNQTAHDWGASANAKNGEMASSSKQTSSTESPWASFAQNNQIAQDWGAGANAKNDEMASSSKQTSSAGSTWTSFAQHSQIAQDWGAGANARNTEVAEPHPVSKRAAEKRAEVDPRRPSIPAAPTSVPLPKPRLPSRAKPMVPNSEKSSSAQDKLLDLRQFSGSEGRVKLYETVIKTTQTVVTLQMQLERAVADEERWKRTQVSQLYARATPATRAKLDSQRAIYAHRVQDLKKRRSRAFHHLLELPEFTVKTPHHPNMQLEKKKIADYTMELRDWFQSLQLDRRLVVARAEANQNSDKTSEMEGQQADQIQSQPQKTAGSLRASGCWSWVDLKDVVEELEGRANFVSEDVYSWANMMDAEFGARLADFRNTLENKRIAQHRKVFQQVASRSKSIGVLLEKEVDKTKGLYERIYSNKNELESLLVETEKVKQICSELESHLEDFETWHQEDSSRIKAMSEQLQTLHKYRKAKPKPAPLKIEDILPKLHPLIQNMVEKEVIPVLDSIYRSCSSNNLKLKAEIAKLLAPVETSAGIVRSRAKVIEAVAAPQPIQH